MHGQAILHRSRIDAWLFAVLAVYAAGSLVLGFALIGLGTGPEPVFGWLCIAAAAFVSWVLLSVRYIITDGRLCLFAGPFRRTIPLSRIVEVYPSRETGLALAPSLDRLRVNYHVGGRWTHRLVAPRDPAAFLRDLAAAEPALQLRGGWLIRTGPQERL